MPSRFNVANAVVVFNVLPMVSVPVPEFWMVSVVADASVKVAIFTAPEALSKIVRPVSAPMLKVVIVLPPVPEKLRVVRDASVNVAITGRVVLVFVSLMVSKAAVSLV